MSDSAFQNNAFQANAFQLSLLEADAALIDQSPQLFAPTVSIGSAPVHGGRRRDITFKKLPPIPLPRTVHVGFIDETAVLFAPTFEWSWLTWILREDDELLAFLDPERTVNA